MKLINSSKNKVSGIETTGKWQSKWNCKSK